MRLTLNIFSEAKVGASSEIKGYCDEFDFDLTEGEIKFFAMMIDNRLIKLNSNMASTEKTQGYHVTTRFKIQYHPSNREIFEYFFGVKNENRNG
jgi:hypothetical protein